MPRPRQATESVLSSLLGVVSSAVQTSTSTSTTTTTTASSSTSTSSSSSRSSRTTTTATFAATTPSSTLVSTTPSSSTTSSSSSSHTTITSSSQSSSTTSSLAIITSSFTTYVNGSALPTHTAFPSTIPQLSTPSSSHRTAIIAGSAAGGTALLIILLSLAFFTRRKQFKRLDFIQAISLKRKQERSRATFLDGEDLDDFRLPPLPHGYSDYDTPWDGTQRALIPRTWAHTSRWSQSGSAFREELWHTNPNPHETSRLIEPLDYMDDPELDLSRIVDNIMGPSSAGMHFSDRSVSSIHRESVVESEGIVHSRTVSNASNTALLEAPRLVGPVRSSPLAQPGTRPAGSSEHETS